MMNTLYTHFPNPLMFTALINGVITLILGSLLGVDIWAEDYSTKDQICQRRLYPFPALTLLPACIWFGYMIVSKIIIKHSSHGLTVEAKYRQKHNRDNDGSWQHPIGFIICSWINAGLLLAGSINSLGAIDFCSGKIFMWWETALTFFAIGIGAPLTSLLYFIKTERLACGLKMKPLRYFMGMYCFIIPFIFLWVLVPFSARDNQQGDNRYNNNNNAYDLNDVQTRSTDDGNTTTSTTTTTSMSADKIKNKKKRSNNDQKKIDEDSIQNGQEIVDFPEVDV